MSGTPRPDPQPAPAPDAGDRPDAHGSTAPAEDPGHGSAAPAEDPGHGSEAPAEQPAQGPAKPARGLPRVREMLLAIGLIIVVSLLFTRSCSFSPGGPTVAPGSAPTVDSAAQLQEAALHTPFALHVPQLPPGWTANSADDGPVVGGGRAVTVGYLTEGGSYVRLVQSDATEENLVAAQAGGPQTATGTVDAAGLTWVVYRVGPRSEAMWVAQLPSTPRSSLLLTGSAPEPDFRALAQAAVDGTVLPVGSAPS